MSIQKLGMNATEQRLNWPQLIATQGVAILFVNGDHFVAVDARGQRDAVRVYDPDGVAKWLNRNELESIWSGNSLIVVAGRSTTSAARSLRASFCYEDLGLLRDVREAKFRFPLKNTGSEAISVRVSNTTCSCTSATISSELVAAGQEVFLEAVVNLERKQGKFSEVVVVESSDSKLGKLSFVLQGQVYRARLLSTERVHIGKVAPGSESRYTVAVFDPGDNRLNVGPLTCISSKSIEKSLSQPLCIVENVKYVDVSEHDRDRFKLSSNDSLLEVVVSIPTDCNAGEFMFGYEVSTGLVERPSLRLFIQGAVLPDLFAEPRAVVTYAPSSGPAMSVPLVIYSRGGRALDAITAKASEKLPVMIEASEYAADSVTFRLSVSPILGAEAHLHGEINFVLPDGRILDVPIIVTKADNERVPSPND